MVGKLIARRFYNKHMDNILKYNHFVKSPSDSEIIQAYSDSVPSKPYCTNELGSLIIRPKDHALAMRYVQHNHPYSISYLVIDVDHPRSPFGFDDDHAPPPTFSVINPNNYHSHMFYRIENKVYKNRFDNIKAYTLLCHIEKEIIRLTDADRSYSQLISKNPTHNSWILDTFKSTSYNLFDFYDYINLPKKEPSQPYLFEFGLGRNCTLFEVARHHAYALYRQSKFELDIDYFINEIFYHISRYNSLHFKTPLFDKELIHIARSVAKWTVQHFAKNVFSNIQSKRGLKSGKVRQEKASKLYKEIKQIALKQPHLSNRNIAELLGISKDTVRKARIVIQDTTDDNELFDDQPSIC